MTGSQVGTNATQSHRRHPVAVMTALTARFVMDVGDIVAGLRAGLLDPAWLGLAQSAAMFLIPAALGAWLARPYLVPPSREAPFQA